MSSTGQFVVIFSILMTLLISQLLLFGLVEPVCLDAAASKGRLTALNK
jgi:hypothetical protein